MFISSSKTTFDKASNSYRTYETVLLDIYELEDVTVEEACAYLQTEAGYLKDSKLLFTVHHGYYNALEIEFEATGWRPSTEKEIQKAKTKAKGKNKKG